MIHRGHGSKADLTPKSIWKSFNSKKKNFPGGGIIFKTLYAFCCNWVALPCLFNFAVLSLLHVLSNGGLKCGWWKGRWDQSLRATLDTGLGKWTDLYGRDWQQRVMLDFKYIPFNQDCSDGGSSSSNDFLSLTELYICLSHYFFFYTLQMQLVSFLFISQERVVMDNMIWWMRQDLGAQVWQETWMWPAHADLPTKRATCSTLVPHFNMLSF